MTLPILSPVTGQTPTLDAHLTTKAYVDAGRGDVAVNTRTAAYTLALGDRGGLVRMNVSTTANVTVPANATVAFPIGTVIRVRRVGTGSVGVVGAGGVTVNWPGGAFTIATQYAMAEIHKVGVDTWDGALLG